MACARRNLRSRKGCACDDMLMCYKGSSLAGASLWMQAVHYVTLY